MINDFENQIPKISRKLRIDADRSQTTIPEGIQYLLDRHPFLEIVGPEMKIQPEQFKIVQSVSGWDIHDYGHSISSSVGHFLFGGTFPFHSNDDEASYDAVLINSGKGTIINQAFHTACDMIEMTSARGWDFVTVVDGHQIMKRAAWIKSVELGINMHGFIPNSRDKRVRKLILESYSEYLSRKENVQGKK